MRGEGKETDRDLAIPMVSQNDDTGGVLRQTQRGNCCSDQYNYCPLCFIIYFSIALLGSPRYFHLLTNSQQQLIYWSAVSQSVSQSDLVIIRDRQLKEY